MMGLPKELPVYRETVSPSVTQELHDLIYDPDPPLSPEMATAMAHFGAEQARKHYMSGRIRDTADSLANLTPREERVLRMRYGIAAADGEPDGVTPNVQLTYGAIAARFNCTRERIRQIQSKALRKLTYRAVAVAGASLTDEMQDKLGRAWRTARGE